MSEPLWSNRPPPDPGPGAARLGLWETASRADLIIGRLQLVTTLVDAGRRPGVSDSAVERLLRAFEELVSNGLRHGRAPVQATVTAYGSCWLIQVSDAAVDRPPTLAAGYGGSHSGLRVVAQICDAHGWVIDGDRKTLWACIDYSRP